MAGATALLPPAAWLWYSHDLYLQYRNTFGVISGADSKFGSLAIWTSSLFWTGNLTIETTLIYGIVGFPIALLGAWLVWKARGPVLLVVGFPALFVFYFEVGRYSSELGRTSSLGRHHRRNARRPGSGDLHCLVPGQQRCLRSL